MLVIALFALENCSSLLLKCCHLSSSSCSCRTQWLQDDWGGETSNTSETFVSFFASPIRCIRPLELVKTLNLFRKMLHCGFCGLARFFSLQRDVSAWWNKKARWN